MLKRTVGHRMMFIAFSCLVVPTFAVRCEEVAAKINGVVKSSTPASMRWEPSWRDPGDCGPLSLYILMKLSGRSVSVEEIKARTPWDAKTGCSLETLLETSSQLGFPAEVRFVNPKDLAEVPRPFILYTQGSLERGVGHFAVVVEHSKSERRFATIDTTFGNVFWFKEDDLRVASSGYVLLPFSNFDAKWKYITGINLICCGVALTSVIAVRRRSF